jgi:hypothetical protein
MLLFASNYSADDKAALQLILNRKLKGVPKKIREQQGLSLHAIVKAYNTVMPFEL